MSQPFESIVDGGPEPVYRYFQGGVWRPSSSGATLELRSPIDDRLLGRIQAMTASEATAAIDDADRSWPAWNQLPVAERAEILRRTSRLIHQHEPTLTELLVLEIGKTVKEAREEVVRTADLIAYFADEGQRFYGEVIWADSFPGYGRDRWALVYREPLGVVLAIAPFNYPLNLSASKIAPALIVGNSVVFKPPLQGSIASAHMVALFHQAGVPPGVLNFVTGDPAIIGDRMVGSRAVRLIAFTGSTGVGRHIAEVAGMTHLLMELGGKDAALVCRDADMELAATQIAKGAFSYAGQRCTAVKRVLVEESAAEPLLQELLARVQALRVGDPRDSTSSYGPLISDRAAAYVRELVAEAVASGARVLCGGGGTGRYLEPTLLDHVTPDMRIAREEQFGPALPILRVGSLDQAIDLANRSDFGLQSCIFTRDIDRAFYFARSLQVGTVNINSNDSRGPDHFPFAGVKDSGLGTQGVHYSINAMSRQRAIVLNHRKPSDV